MTVKIPLLPTGIRKLAPVIVSVISVLTTTRSGSLTQPAAAGAANPRNARNLSSLTKKPADVNAQKSLVLMDMCWINQNVNVSKSLV